MVVARFGGRVRDFRVLVCGNGLVLKGRVGSFHLKQLVQKTVVRATSFRIVAIVAKEVAVD